jgi:hypothetical protein
MCHTAALSAVAPLIVKLCIGWCRHPRSPCRVCLSCSPPSCTLGRSGLALALAYPGLWRCGQARPEGVGQPSPCGHRPVAHHWSPGGRGDGHERVYRGSAAATGNRSARCGTPAPEANAARPGTAGYRGLVRLGDPVGQPARHRQPPATQSPQAHRGTARAPRCGTSPLRRPSSGTGGRPAASRRPPLPRL